MASPRMNYVFPEARVRVDRHFVTLAVLHLLLATVNASGAARIAEDADAAQHVDDIFSQSAVGVRDSNLEADDEEGSVQEDADVKYRVADRFADDIFSQSGVRVRNWNLMADGVECYEQFMASERTEQRAFIWWKIGLEEINFVHSTAASPVTQLAKPKDIRDVSQAELEKIKKTLGARDLELTLANDNAGLTFDHVRTIAWTLDNLQIFIDSMYDRPRYTDKPGAIVTRDADPVAYAAFMDPRFRANDAVVNYRANHRTLVKDRLALLDIDDPGFNLQGPWRRMLGDFRELVETIAPPSDDLWSRLIEQELHRPGQNQRRIALDVNVDALTGMSPGDMYRKVCDAVEQQIMESYRDVVSREQATKILQGIADAETTMANAYAKFNNPTCGVMQELQLNSGDLTPYSIEEVYQRALYRREEFHKMTIPFVASDDLANPGPTYRVHFTDPEYRYVELETTIVVPEKTKIWYESLWKRLMEPIFKKVVIQEMKETSLRDITLVHIDHTEDGILFGEVTSMGQGMVIDCTHADKDHALLEETIRHEYEHVVDHTTDYFTLDDYKELQDEDDISTLTLDSLEENIKNINAEISDSEKQEKQLTGLSRILTVEEIMDSLPSWSRLHTIEGLLESFHISDASTTSNHVENSKMYMLLSRRCELNLERLNLETAKNNIKSVENKFIFNADNEGGFVSTYAQMSSRETVAEQRSAMRKEHIRIALLRRMSLSGRQDIPAERRKAAERQKQFYDIARNVMEDVAPQLYRQWGSGYDYLPPARWGLFRGATPKTDTHHAIMVLDHSLASKFASEGLATRLLGNGYDVAIFAYDPIDNDPKPILQSNFDDQAPGYNDRTSILHVVGGSVMGGQDVASRVVKTFTDFTHAGRKNIAHPNLNFDTVYFWRPPYQIDFSVNDGHLLRNFKVEFEKIMQAHRDLDIDNIISDIHLLYEPAEHAYTVAGDKTRTRGQVIREPVMWPNDRNLYQTTIFRGWFVDGRQNKEYNVIDWLEYLNDASRICI